jgi:hypothetical protein
MSQRLARQLAALAVLVTTALAGTRAVQAQSTKAMDVAASTPDTPAGRALHAYLEALNSGERTSMDAFYAAHKAPGSGENLMQLSARTGGFDLLQVLTSEPRHIEFVVKEKKSTNVARGQLDIGSGDETTVSNFLLRMIPPGASPDPCHFAGGSTNGAVATPVAADPNDVSSPDAIIGALYDVISGPACKRRNWNRFRSLFVDGARLIPTGMGPDRKARIRALTPDEYAANSRSSLEENGFFEREIARTGESFGNMTHAFSTYESRHAASDDKPFARGINSIQLFNDGTRWWVVTVYWDSERAGNPISPQYLRKPPE